MPDLQTQIEQIVADAANRITALVQQAAVESISSTLGALAGNGARGRAAGRPTAPRVRATAARTTTSRPPGRGRAAGAKRAPEEIEATKNRVAEFIAANPGLRIEQINKELGTTTPELMLPLRKLIASKAIRTEGQRRSTKYFVAGGGRASGGRKGRSRSKRRAKA